MTNVVLIAATRKNSEEFSENTWLGASLKRLEFDSRIRAIIAFQNTLGLPLVYNAAAKTCNDEDIAVFLHDDVRIDDYHLVDRLTDAMKHFDVVGAVGNRRRQANQPGWGFIDDQGCWDEREYLSGSVGHGETGRITRFGPSPAACELLDGLFLATQVKRLRSTGVSFDPRFAFHLYDLDFCRTARTAGMKVGTWPIALTHRSTGNFDQSWRDSLQIYFKKWQS